MNYAHWQFNRRFTDLPARVALRVEGLALARQHRLQRSRPAARPSVPHQPRKQAAQWQLRVRTDQHQQRRLDDLLTRGNGVVRLPPNFNSYFEYERPRIGQLGLRSRSGSVQRRAVGQRPRRLPLRHRAALFHQRRVQPVRRRLEQEHTPDWLVWQQTICSAASTSTRPTSNAGFNWIMTNRHELRLKLQAIGLSAEAAPGVPGRRWCGHSHRRAGRRFQRRESRRAAALPLRVPAALISLRRVRPRGIPQEPVADEPASLVRDSFELRDDEQLLVKFSYRFEN